MKKAAPFSMCGGSTILSRICCSASFSSRVTLVWLILLGALLLKILHDVGLGAASSSITQLWGSVQSAQVSGGGRTPLTNLYRIEDSPARCSLSNDSQQLRIVYGTFSMAKLYEFREVHRRTWHKFPQVCKRSFDQAETESKPCSILPVFVVGLPANEEEAKLIAEENSTYGDLVVLNIPENMNNGKSLAWWQHAARAFPHATHVAKGDMDTFIWAGDFVKELASLPSWQLYYGRSNTFSICGCVRKCPKDFTYVSGQMILMSTDLVQWVGDESNPITRPTMEGHEDVQTGKWVSLAPFPVIQVGSKTLPFEHPLKDPQLFPQKMSTSRARRQHIAPPSATLFPCPVDAAPRVVLAVPIHPDNQDQVVPEKWLSHSRENNADTCLYSTDTNVPESCSVMVVPVWCKGMGELASHTYFANASTVLELDCTGSVDPMFSWWSYASKAFLWATHIGRADRHTHIDAKALVKQLATLPQDRVYYGRMKEELAKCSAYDHSMDSQLYVLSSDLVREIRANMTLAGTRGHDLGMADKIIFPTLQMDPTYYLQVNLARKKDAQPWVHRG
eukprot:comp17648_c0_seq1/m.17418 comp17648_c0_seq1/g.17418  ORF comp17648_c0_seq1/g.17418 comp17648_c0_seq1/m.17418 type:complete len:562 (-) comp17648_c0_seq1:666-2351(-)